MMTIHDDTLQGLNELLAYAKGDNTKARVMTITAPNEKDTELFFQKFERLSPAYKQKAIQYVEELLQA